MSLNLCWIFAEQVAFVLENCMAHCQGFRRKRCFTQSGDAFIGINFNEYVVFVAARRCFHDEGFDVSNAQPECQRGIVLCGERRYRDSRSSKRCRACYVE